MSEKEQNGYSPEPEENAAKGAEEQFEETQRLDVDDAEMHTAPLKNGGRPKEFESSDNWQFDASAPSADADVLEGAGGAQFDFAAGESAAATRPAEQQGGDNQGDDHIVLNRGKVTAVLSVLIAAVVIAIIVVLGVRYYTVPNGNEDMNPGNVAMTVGNTDISVGLYNYFYDSVVYEYTNYANYGYYELDSSSDFSKQATTDEDGNQISWLDLFKQTTTQRIQMLVAYYEKGVEAGVTVTDSQKEQMESQLEMIRSGASSAGLGVNEYSEQSFGAHCGLETLRKYMEMSYIANNFYNRYCITQRPDEQEFTAYFDENSSDYMSCSFAVLEMEYDTADDASKQASIDNAVEYMQQITDVDSMRDMIPQACAPLIERFVSAGYFENSEEAVSVLSESLETTQARSDFESTFGTELADWLFSSETAVGSTDYYANESVGVIYVVLKTSEPFLQDDDVLYSVRHILVTPESGEETASANPEYTDEEWQAAEQEAQNILKEYESGDKSELSFALLAEKYSDDTETTSNGSGGLFGGAYEGVTPGSSVEAFDDWCTDPARAYGDVEIVKTEYGYHIIFFIDMCPRYEYQAKTDCVSDKLLKLIDSAEVKDGIGFKNADSATPSSDYVAKPSGQ